jgi:putative hydrolase of the HAD superfamily
MSRLPIKVIAFDADDTLWDCQSHFEEVENHLYSLIAPYCENPKHELFLTESGNMADLGYGCKAFTISIIETALHIAGNDLSATQLKELLAHCKQLLHLPATPLPEVEQTLKTLRSRLEGDSNDPVVGDLQSPTRMVVFTKGELQDQENKLKRSGLLDYFDDVEITSDKSQREFLDLCEHQQIHPSELLMIGNSLKSDIAPALAIGAWAIHIPFHVTWQLEHFDDIDHDCLIKISHFSEILKYI